MLYCLTLMNFYKVITITFSLLQKLRHEGVKNLPRELLLNDRSSIRTLAARLWDLLHLNYCGLLVVAQ